MSLGKGYISKDADTHRENIICRGGKTCSDTAASQGTPRIDSNPQEKLGENHRTNSLFKPPEETKLADTWITDF